MDVGGQFRQDAVAAVGAVAATRMSSSGNQAATRWISSRASSGRVRWLGSGLALAALALAGHLPWPFSLWSVPGGCDRADGDGQGEDFGGGPERVDDEQAEDDPVVPPTDQGFGAAGDERVVVHAGAVEGQAAFAAEGVVDGPEERGTRREDGDTTSWRGPWRRCRGPRRRG